MGSVSLEEKGRNLQQRKIILTLVAINA